MEMKQMGLIDQILDALGLDSKMAMNKYMPAKAKLLRHVEDGEGPQGLFSSRVLLECSCIFWDIHALTSHML